jgi:peptidoglycan/xylan/chitin deacetylase (PgdA/CDA1 family)
MIGVAVEPAARPVAAEFFELFKVGWEFCEPGRSYDVLISTSESFGPTSASLCLFFGQDFATFDAANGISSRSLSERRVLVYSDHPLPIYGACATFSVSTVDLIYERSSKEPAAWARRSGAQTTVRVGYDLFDEVRHLLTAGQPIEHAGTPTLDLHIALLREIITRAGLPVVEIPPAPAGSPFMACLTHDIDHPVTRNHRGDHTMVGFLLRAAVVSPMDVCRGRLSFGQILQNWAAVLRLPFVYLGLARDPWSRFADDYLRIEHGLGATYFFIPERDNPGQKKDGPAPPKRASKYTLQELGSQLRKIAESGNEIGLHGLDSWRDPVAGRRETQLLAESVAVSNPGIRMHWLYFDENSFRVLEDAGFTYDSTFGYNATVGYRAGTTQAFRPIGNSTLLELPLHVMDTALFYPSYLHLKETEAFRVVSRMMDHAAAFGGTLTLNWHDRSLFAERLWGTFYVKVLDELKRRGAWFPTAKQAAAWFRKRRQAAVTFVRMERGKLEASTRAPESDALPPLQLRIHHPCSRNDSEVLASGTRACVVDVPFDNVIEVQLNN